MKKSVRSAVVRTAVLVALLAALSAYYFFRFSNSSSRGKASTSVPVLPDFRPNDADFLSIRVELPTNRFTVTLKKTDGSWRLTSPVSDDAEPESVSTLLNALQSLQSDRVFSNARPAERKDFGLDRPFAVVETGGGIPLRLVVGGASADGRYQYAMRTDRSNAVYLIPAGQFSNILKGPDGLRGREIFDIDLRDLSRAEWFSSGKGRVSMVFGGSEGNDVRMDFPADKKLDALKVRSKMIGLYSLAASGFTRYGSPDRFGLDKPRFWVKLRSRDGRNESLHVGTTNAAGEHYAWVPRKKAVVLIGDDELESKLTLGPEDVLPGKTAP